jgi:hypothetical protein
MKYKSFAIPILSMTYCCLSVSPARAGWFSDKINQFGDKIAKVVDITDKNSDARRILRSLDVTDPNSPACKTLRNGGDEVAGAAAAAGPKGMAVATVITTAKKICGNAASGKAISPEQAEVDMAVMYQTQLAIEQAKQNGQTERVKILESTKIELEKLQQNGQTERVKIVQDNLLATTLSNNQTQIALGEQNLKAIESGNWTELEKVKTTVWGGVVQTGVQKLGDILQGGQQTSAQVEIERIRKERDIEIARINAGIEDPSIALLKTWKLTPVPCSSITASILIDGKEYCTNTNDKLRAAKYAYNPNTQRVQALNPVPTSQPMQPIDSNVAMLRSWKLTVTDCNHSSSLSIYIDNQRYCAIPNDKYRAGQYVYDRATKRLSNADNRTPRPRTQSSSGFR